MDPVSLSVNSSGSLPSVWNLSDVEKVAPTAQEKAGMSIFDGPFNQPDVFRAGNQAIEMNGGVMDPSALLRSQVQVLSAEMSWIFTAQLANKASSGVQTLFNNQV
jgi:hypothetical protein